MTTLRSYKEILTTSKLAVGYKDVVLFENLNIALCAGELVCFMGPNGAGKSSLIRTLCGLQKPLAGQASLTNTNSSDEAASKINHLISVVLTDRISAQHMTVGELITYGRYPYLDWSIRLSDEDKNAIDKAIRLVRIEHLKNRRLFELSDGQVQLTMIARALAQDTPAILLDEPTAHLDLNNRLEIMKLLRELSHTLNKGILIATHDLDLALQTADKIWLTGKDKNIIEGIPEDLVLNGMFDSIFEFKGFDLKTGKVQHHSYRPIKIEIVGEGYSFLWTKNALERNGYEIVSEGDMKIHVSNSGTNIRWETSSGDVFHTLRDLLIYIGQQEQIK